VPKVTLSRGSISFLRLGDWTSDVPVVFIHGLAASSAFWFPAANTVRERHPVLVYDLIGHGRSGVRSEGLSAEAQAMDLIALLDVLDIPKAILVGHSFGGAVALTAVALQPSRFARIALADTRLLAFQANLSPQDWPNWLAQKAFFEDAGIPIDPDDPESGVSILTALAKLQLSTTADPAVLQPWVMKYFGQPQSQHAARRWVKLVESSSLRQDIRISGPLTTEWLASLSLPLLAVYGKNSPLLPSGLALHAIQPRADFRVIEGAGHFFPALRPATFVEPLLEFLESVQTPPSQ